MWERLVAGELVGVDVAEAGQLGSHLGTGVMGHKVDNGFVATPAAKVPGTVDLMEPDVDQLGSVTDVVQVRGRAEGAPLGNDFGEQLRPLRHTLHMIPALRRVVRQQATGEFPAPATSILAIIRLDTPTLKLQFVTLCELTSPPPIGSNARVGGRSEPASPTRRPGPRRPAGS